MSQGLVSDVGCRIRWELGQHPISTRSAPDEHPMQIRRKYYIPFCQ